jgi:Fic-DOC domain mobile mystery protein B
MEAGPEPYGATPLGPDEMLGLKLAWVTTREDLNAAEQANILEGLNWSRRRTRTDLLTEQFVRRLHVAMFGLVWRWAGDFRQREVNIGVAPHTIPVALRDLVDDVRFWIENGTFPPDEIAVRLHHRMVLIHPFPNGNGRHTRMMADLVAGRLGQPPFTWGSTILDAPGDVRRRYIESLRRADDHDIGPLLAFARS